MCGRAAQTYRAVSAAARSLGVDDSWQADLPHNDPAPQADESDSVFDNYNMSPGMDALVIWRGVDDGKVRIARKTWGLVTRPGSEGSPIPAGMNLHFSNMMFNARSDTLWEKPTFSRLAAQGRSCLVAVTGFYEWKEGVGKGSKKQPFFVYRKQADGDTKDMHSPDTICNGSFLLMAGLWASVSTGRGNEDPTLDTFTILTTDVCEPLKWLHTRMPLCIWDEKLALEWLEHPSVSVHQRLEQASIATPSDMFDWHAVSPDMTSLKFRSRDALKPMPSPVKITSFFQKKADPDDTKEGSLQKASASKRSLGLDSESATQSSSASSSPPKRQKTSTSATASPLLSDKKTEKTSKKGPLDNFFAKKKPT